ncbi:MAG: type I secretion system permease/ATPase [Richelia sp. RM2_1_2]|nr:type I secretion system permease/ATPase [Richelia sp. SM1_7_0]NJN12259.1 type I secretion system permease/ATPase [Richelia sp. RM1_1_1]NJO29789.1 type I secretion system permease/ATPase [Richelia sp. SL_2_1]NJO63275.1 type I secretion system permease/ATPase [Richelia sp. RM2_1_2]
MAYTTTNIQEFLAEISPFNQLQPAVLTKLLEKVQLFRYRMGQVILAREKMPAQVSILHSGQVRLLGYEPESQIPVTLARLQPGEVMGWLEALRGVGGSTAIASTEVICINLNTEDFLALLSQEESFASYFYPRAGIVEVFELLSKQLKTHANSQLILEASDCNNCKELALKIFDDAQIANLTTREAAKQLNPDYLWLVSGGTVSPDVIGNRFDSTESLPKGSRVRLLGLQKNVFSPQPRLEDIGEEVQQAHIAEVIPGGSSTTYDDIPYAPLELPEAANNTKRDSAASKYPHVRGSGGLNAILACFQMLSKHLNMPFRREVIRKVLINQQKRTGSLSLQQCGAVAQLVGLRPQLIGVPASAIGRIEAPAIVQWQDSFAVLYEISPKTIILGVPESGILRQKPSDVAQVLLQSNPQAKEEQQQDVVPVLLLQATSETPQQKFGLSWFLPSLVKYKGVLTEVFVASFFVQLFGLANPLVTQVIIDKVINQNSPDTLQVLGIFLLVIAVFEAVLTSIRTYLFVDTTNRIDLTLGSEIIDHLLRLPLRYFEKRPVGELSTRVNELEKIRQFLTGTALTVVLDAIFSIIYIVVMFIYSWLLALVALATLPLFAILTFVVSPIVRRQLRVKAERNAEAQSHLVEILSGIQTVKAQNIELRSRWQWQERYARYVSAGFKTVLTSTSASSTSGFLNKLSGLLVLWVGAFLVLEQKLTLGELIAFRIIAGYVTSPLLRLTQLWQNFQETALSLERLSDIIDSPQEATEEDKGNIPMPMIEGAVKFDNVSFRFKPTGPMQLNNVNLEFPAGVFVGVVGQSGSGKSTLMKLVPRLYPLESGRILIDGYDINKVELYSLREQVGIVPQDTLLFEGPVQENIALNYPDATPEEIIEAAKIAVAHDFIMDLPNGYNSRVGERGSALSGGQRQRIAIARTILQNPRLLILDEATSALDYESERQVCLNLAEAFKGRTVFFITHRLSTIRNADTILMLDKGYVVEQGTHQELMSLKGRYYCLYQQQEAQI